MTNAELAKYLRCIATAGGEHKCGPECPYYIEERLPKELVEPAGQEYWPSCDSDRVCLDAAERLESLKDHVDLARWTDLMNETVAAQVRINRSVYIMNEMNGAFPPAYYDAMEDDGE